MSDRRDRARDVIRKMVAEEIWAYDPDEIDAALARLERVVEAEAKYEEHRSGSRCYHCLDGEQRCRHGAYLWSLIARALDAEEVTAP